MAKRKNRSNKSPNRAPNPTAQSRNADKQSDPTTKGKSKSEGSKSQGSKSQGSKSQGDAPRFAPPPPQKRPLILISMLVAWVVFLIFLVIAATVG